MQDFLPLMIFGLPGVPGFSAFYYFKAKYPKQVYSQRPIHQSTLHGEEGVITLDAEQGEKVTDILKSLKIKSVIDASGCCALKSCEYNPEMSKLVNFDFGVSIAKACHELDLRLIRMSTDMVFDGSGSGNYIETDAISPITVYGRTMAEAEEKILSEYSKTAIFRISLPMGPSHSGHAGAIDWIESRFKKNLPATLYYDEIRSSFYVQDMLKVFEHYFNNPFSGIFHLGGPRKLSLNQIAQIINKLGNYPPELLHGSLRHEAGPIPPRVGNVSMNCSKLENLLPLRTLNSWPLEEKWVPATQDWHFHRESLIDDGVMSHLYGYSRDMDKAHPVHWIP